MENSGGELWDLQTRLWRWWCSSIMFCSATKEPQTHQQRDAAAVMSSCSSGAKLIHFLVFNFNVGGKPCEIIHPGIKTGPLSQEFWNYGHKGR